MKKLLLLILVVGISGCTQQVPTNLQDLGGEFVRNGQMLAIVKQGLKDVPDLCSILTPDEMDQIKSLDLHSNDITLVDADLSCLPNLTEIDLSFNKITKVEYVGLDLKKLFLHQNQINGFGDISGSYGNLESLVISDNNIQNLDGVEQFPSLTNLELHHNQLESLQGIDSLQKLEKIKLEKNKLDSISELDALPNLGFVTAGYNNISDEILEPWAEKSRQYIQNKRQ